MIQYECYTFLLDVGVVVEDEEIEKVDKNEVGTITNDTPILTTHHDNLIHTIAITR